MSEPAKQPSGPTRRAGSHRPVWIGWSVTAVVLAVASVIVATGLSDRGAGVRLPPAIDIGTGISWQPTSSTSPAQAAPTTEPPTVEVPPDTSQVQVTQQPRPDVSPPDTAEHSGSGSTVPSEPRDSTGTVSPDYPVVTGGSTDSQPGGGSDS